MSTESTAPSRRARWFALGSILLAALLLHAPRLNRPFGPDIASAAASYQILFARNWDEAGFGALRGVPCVGAARGTVTERAPYLHHPVLSYWGSYALRTLFGWKPWVFRLLPFLALCASALLVTLVGLRVLGSVGGFLTGAIFLLSPGIQRFGDMPNPESLVLCALLGIWLLHERIRENPTRARKAAFFAAAFVGMLIDWQVFFIVPTLLLGEALRPRHERRWREALLLPVICCAALTTTLAHFAWGIGSVESLGREISATVQDTLQSTAPSFGAFVAAQGRALRDSMGWGLLCAGVLLLLSVLTGRARADRTRMVVALLLPALLSVVCFRGPAFDHAFWWMPATAFFALAGGWLLVKLLHLRPLVGALGCLLLLGALALESRVAERRSELPAGWYESVAALVDRFAQPGDVVLTPEPFGPALFYARTRIYENIRSSVQVEAVQRRVHGGRVHVFMLEASGVQHAAFVRWLDAHGQRTRHPAIAHWTL